MTPFGVPDTATYGEILTTDSNIFLTDFSFYLQRRQGDQINFKAYVYSWDDVGHKINGTALFSSDILETPASSSSFTKITISTGNILLAANSNYALFFSTSGLTQTTTGTYDAGYTNTNNPKTRFAFIIMQVILIYCHLTHGILTPVMTWLI